DVGVVGGLVVALRPQPPRAPADAGECDHDEERREPALARRMPAHARGSLLRVLGFVGGTVVGEGGFGLHDALSLLNPPPNARIRLIDTVSSRARRSTSSPCCTSSGCSAESTCR